MKLLQTGEPYK